MKWESVLAWRVERQHLAERATDALAVASDLCGLHAQVLSSAQLTLWARMDDPPDVEDLLWKRALARQDLVAARHAAPAATDELPLYVGAQAGLKPRYEQKSWLKDFKLTAKDAQTIIEGVPKALKDGPLTREELAAQVHHGLGRGYGDLLKPVAFRGELIFAESQGQNVRFALPEPFEPLDTEEATTEIARRYLTRYGPGTREDLAKWFGSPSPAVCGRWIKALGDEWSRPSSAGRSPPTSTRSRPPSRPASSTCCPRSTSTWSPRRATRGRRARRSASTARAAGSRPCCSSTA